jgi:ribosomal-protein-alanine N-acetyltransferase
VNAAAAGPDVARATVTIERLEPPVRLADRAAVLALEAESFTNPWTADTFEKMLTSPVSQVYVARLDDRTLVAFCACWVIDHEMHINTVAVDVRRRRRGIAEHLLREALRQAGVRTATLEVRQSNEAALGLYRKLGFEVRAVRKESYQNPVEDGLILWWNP